MRVKSLEETIKENLCYQSQFLNTEEIMRQNQELLNKGKYYPKLIRLFISNNYYLTVNDNVLKKCYKTKNNTPLEDVMELYDWIKKNREHEDLIYKEELENLIEKLNKLYPY